MENKKENNEEIPTTKEEFINYILEKYQEKIINAPIDEFIYHARRISWGNYSIGSYKFPSEWGKEAVLILINRRSNNQKRERK